MKRKTRRCFRDEGGATLIEVVLLLVILGIAVAPLSLLSVNNLTQGANYTLMTRSLGFAQEAMEEIIADYQATSAGRGYSWVRTNWSGYSDNPATGFTRTVSISSETHVDGVNMVTVEVRITHSSISDVVLQTVLAS